MEESDFRKVKSRRSRVAFACSHSVPWAFSLHHCFSSFFLSFSANWKKRTRKATGTARISCFSIEESLFLYWKIRKDRCIPNNSITLLFSLFDYLILFSRCTYINRSTSVLWLFQELKIDFNEFFSLSIYFLNFNNYHLSFIFKTSHLSILRGKSTIPNDQITKHRMVRNRSPTFDRLIGRVSNENVQLLLESVRGEIRAKLWTNWARLRFSLDIGDARNRYLYLSVGSFVHPTERVSHPPSNPLSFVFSQQSNRHWRSNRFSPLVEIILSVSGIPYPIGWNPVLSGGRKRRNKIKNKVRERNRLRNKNNRSYGFIDEHVKRHRTRIVVAVITTL